jgi:hypothetical protein
MRVFRILTERTIAEPNLQRAPDPILDKGGMLLGAVASGNGCDPVSERSVRAMFRPDLAISFLRCAPDVSSGEV